MTGEEEREPWRDNLLRPHFLVFVSLWADSKRGQENSWEARSVSDAEIRRWLSLMGARSWASLIRSKMEERLKPAEG
jgi:hypothetical protein